MTPAETRNAYVSGKHAPCQKIDTCEGWGGDVSYMFGIPKLNLETHHAEFTPSVMLFLPSASA